MSRMLLKLTFTDGDTRHVETGRTRDELYTMLNVYNDFPWIDFGDQLYRVDGIIRIDIIDEEREEAGDVVADSRALHVVEAHAVLGEILDVLAMEESPDPSMSYLDRLCSKIYNKGLYIGVKDGKTEVIIEDE